MRGPRSIFAAICSALVFTSISLSPRFAHAQTFERSELQFPIGIEIVKPIGFPGSATGPTLSVFYAPNRLFAVGVTGSYAPLTTFQTCAEDDSAASDAETCWSVPIVKLGPVFEFDILRRRSATLFIDTGLGLFGEINGLGDGNVWTLYANAGVGAHLFIVGDVLSIDPVVRIMATAPPDNNGTWVAWTSFGLAITPRLVFRSTPL